MKQGWEIKKLGDVCDFKSGTTISLSLEREFGDVLYIKVSDMNLPENEIEINTSTRFVNSNEIKQVQIIPEGAVIFPKRGGAIATNKKRKVIKPTIVDLNTMALIPFNKLDSEFFYYWFQMIDLNAISNGTTIPQINNYSFDDIHISYPKSIHEQQHIVSILDECFAAINKAKANAEQNLKNAKELFESYLQGVFENGNWEERELGNLCNLITKGSSPKWQGIKYIDKPGVLFVTSENVGEGKMLLSEKKYVEEKFNWKEKKSILKMGDVLTNIVGASIGRTAIYNINDIANINQAVCILRCNPELILNKYLMNLLNSPFLKKILHDNEVNTARANLSLGFFNKLTIPCPSLKEQQTIVHQLDTLRIETQKLEAVYQKKIEDLEELKKSILQKAFAGELKTNKVHAS
jgi:type I restriction enzyme S subunit